MAVDISKWPRLMEIYNYAAERDIDTEHAVLELVNKGLSHL